MSTCTASGAHLYRLFVAADSHASHAPHVVPLSLVWIAFRHLVPESRRLLDLTALHQLQSCGVGCHAATGGRQGARRGRKAGKQGQGKDSEENLRAVFH